MVNDFNHDIVQLISVMVKAFHKKKKGKSITERIQRGRARASANEFEEELSRLIEKYTPADVRLLVDFPMSFGKSSSKRAKTIYPDIAFIRGGSLIGIVEAKIDLGYLSRDWVRERKQITRHLISNGIVQAEECEISVSKRLMTACIVLTAKNHTERLLDFKKKVDNAFVLISKEHSHPNDNNIVGRSAVKGYLEKIALDKSHKQEWKRLEQFVRHLAQNQ